MDIKEIRTLLAKYDEARTSLQEEKELRDYFAGEIIEPEFLPYRLHFSLLQSAMEDIPPVSKDFENRLTEMIDSRDRIILPANRERRIFRIAVAAAIAILIGIAGALVVRENWNRNRDTYSDPQQAYAEARKTLLYVSRKMNSGIESLAAVSKLKEGTEPLKSLKKLDHGLDMINLVSFVNNSSNLKK